MKTIQELLIITMCLVTLLSCFTATDPVAKVINVNTLMILVALLMVYTKD